MSLIRSDLHLTDAEILELRGMDADEEAAATTLLAALFPGEPFEFFAIAPAKSDLRRLDEDEHEEKDYTGILTRLLHQVHAAGKIGTCVYIGPCPRRVLCVYRVEPDKYQPLQILEARRRLAMKISASLAELAHQIEDGLASIPPKTVN